MQAALTCFGKRLRGMREQGRDASWDVMFMIMMEQIQRQGETAIEDTDVVSRNLGFGVDRYEFAGRVSKASCIELRLRWAAFAAAVLSVGV